VDWAAAAAGGSRPKRERERCELGWSRPRERGEELGLRAKGGKRDFLFLFFPFLFKAIFKRSFKSIRIWMKTTKYKIISVPARMHNNVATSYDEF